MNITDRFDDTGEGMTIYEAIRYLYSIADNAHPFRVPQEEVRALNMCRDLADAYDTLAPDWANAPEWAQFYVVVPGGRAFWSETELEILPEGDGWRDKDEIGLLSLAGLVDLPLGIDWRLCKWSREVTR